MIGVLIWLEIFDTWGTSGISYFHNANYFWCPNNDCRKYPTVDMVPAQFVAGVSSCLIGFLLSSKIMISPHDIFLGFLAGFFQVGFGFIFITIGARTTPSALVGIIMLSEAVLGPLWAFLFVSERPSIFGLLGGAIILFAVLLQFYSLLTKSKKKVSYYKQ